MGLARRLYAYPSVRGALYAALNGRVDLHVVASRPMNRAVQMLAEAWLGEFRSLYPQFDWKVSTHTVPPDRADDLRCLFWRHS